MTLRDSLIAAIVPIFLGFGFVIAKPAMEHLPPFLLMGLRFTFVALLLVWWFPIPKAFLKKIFLASLVANTTQYSITYTGLSFIDASAAVLLVQTEVPFGVLFAYFMLKEKPTVRSLIGITIAFIGVYILTGSPNLDGNTYENIKTASMNSWIIAIYLGFIMQPITYGCFYYVLKNNPMYKVLPIVTMGIPLTGLLAAVFLLGEKPTVELFIGGLVILIGVVMIVFKTSKKST